MMSMQAAGYTCPLCNYDGGPFEILKIIENEAKQIIAIDLQCSDCDYTWRAEY